MSTKQIRSLSDFMRFDVDILVVCKCGKQTELPWLPVLTKFQRKGWPLNLESAKMRFRCLACKKPASRLEPASRSS